MAAVSEVPAVAGAGITATFLRWTFLRVVCHRGYVLASGLYFVVAVHLSAARLVLLGAVVAVTLLLSDIPAGAWSDAFSRKRPLVIGHGGPPRSRIRQTGRMGSVFARAVNDMDEAAFQALYGRWDSLDPGQVAELFSGSPVRWWVVGGRAARVGAAPRSHEDTDVAVCRADLDELCRALSGWHLWEANDGSLRPLLPGQHPTAAADE